MSELSISRRLQPLLDRLQAGDDTARNDLINLTYDRFRSLAGKVLQSGFTRLKRWEDSTDVVNEAAMRLWESLAEVKPKTPREFLGLGAVQIRRQLLDLSRKYFGRKTKDGSPAATPERSPTQAQEIGEYDAGAGDTWDPASLAIWTELHEHIARLPDDERETADLIIYQGLTQEDAAEVIGVDKSTVKRRFRSVRRKLARAMNGGEDGTTSA